MDDVVGLDPVRGDEEELFGRTLQMGLTRIGQLIDEATASGQKRVSG